MSVPPNVHPNAFWNYVTWSNIIPVNFNLSGNVYTASFPPAAIPTVLLRTAQTILMEFLKWINYDRDSFRTYFPYYLVPDLSNCIGLGSNLNLDASQSVLTCAHFSSSGTPHSASSAAASGAADKISGVNYGASRANMAGEDQGEPINTCGVQQNFLSFTIPLSLNGSEDYSIDFPTDPENGYAFGWNASVNAHPMISGGVTWNIGTCVNTGTVDTSNVDQMINDIFGPINPPATPVYSMNYPPINPGSTDILIPQHTIPPLKRRIPFQNYTQSIPRMIKK